jgi:hypothetical protein
MRGFFTWEAPRRDSPAASAQCPNCGVYVQRDLIAEHECSAAQLEAHHLRLLTGEFWAVADRQRNRGPDRDEHLLHWRPFGDWLTTAQGRFAEYEARRQRR